MSQKKRTMTRAQAIKLMGVPSQRQLAKVLGCTPHNVHQWKPPNPIPQGRMYQVLYLLSERQIEELKNEVLALRRRLRNRK